MTGNLLARFADLRGLSREDFLVIYCFENGAGNLALCESSSSHLHLYDSISNVLAANLRGSSHSQLAKTFGQAILLLGRTLVSSPISLKLLGTVRVGDSAAILGSILGKIL
jgi:hypothetical protein